MRIFLLSQLLLCLLFRANGFGQVTASNDIASFPLEITTSKTTHLIFPFSIKTVDRGSPDILAQKAAGVENILQVKAGKADFDTTNLTVITSDGKLFSFMVGYADQPLSLNIQINGNSSVLASFQESSLNEAQITELTVKALADPSSQLSMKDRSSKAELLLSSILVDGDLIFFKIELSNNSVLAYGIENLRFFVRDRKNPKRTAIQETEIKPLQILGDTNTVAARSSHAFVFVLPKMTIPDKKYLAVQVQEKNGGRHLLLKVRNRHLLKALPIQH